MCHMMADSISELHEMAEKIGLKREWYRPKSSPHYDLSISKRRVAIKLGAIEADGHKIVELIKKFRALDKAILVEVGE